VLPRSRASRIARALRNVALFAASAIGSFAIVATHGCGTEATGVDDCRDIEQARCIAGAACGIVADPSECRRFYRDHCLHGLPVKGAQRADVDQCVAAIQAAGECAKTEGGRTAELAACSPQQASKGTLACEVVQYPERAYACSFLTGKPVSPPEDTGQGGQGGQAGGGG